MAPRLLLNPCRNLQSQHASLSPHISKRPVRVSRFAVQASSSSVTVSSPVKTYSVESLRGTSRKQNEDRYDVKVSDGRPEPGSPLAYVGVFDGHGGYAVAEWLKEKLFGYVEEYWQDGKVPKMAITDAFIQADSALLQPKSGFLGMVGERGVGGSKCGATGAVALIYPDADGSLKLLTANAGDARAVLVRGGKALQLTEDHVPDSEEERKRIERQNPNPKMPLVRYVAGTWRVGGLLALSRAFGDAYLKGSLQFEGVVAGSDGYSSGFGVVAEPYTDLVDLTPEDTWLIVASDGLFENEVRGGGGGLTNEEVAAMCSAAGPSETSEAVAKRLAAAAVEAGTTDDVTVAVLRFSL